MRKYLPALFALCVLSSFAHAQGEKRPEIKKIEVGFQTYQKEDLFSYKVGLWTPIYIEVYGGTEGIEVHPFTYLEIETVDSDDVGTHIRIPVAVKPNGSRTFTGYVKTGRMSHGGQDIKVTLYVNRREFPSKTFEQYSTLEVDAHLYLTLGPRIAHLQAAVAKIDKQQGDPNEKIDNNRPQFRNAVFESNVERLPSRWFGYNGVDLIVLSTDNRDFLKNLNSKDHADKLDALAQWVRRGGRLVVPIAHENQDVVSKLLSSPVWDPPIPVVPPAARDPKDDGLRRLSGAATWGGVLDQPFQRDDPRQKIVIARLDDGKVPPGNWQVFAASEEDTGNRPLITQVRYGLGQITYLAFSLGDNSFLQWPGKEKFLQTMIHKLAPRAPGVNFNDRFGRNDPNDVTTDLVAALDKFDVTVIPFGYVALFIVLYILVVGPLDFILLKYVFKRLEWTWITFPAVVLGVSVIAYFAAYALKGRDLKVNKIDIVDFDMRTTSDPKNVHAYGHSYFTILSPRIQNYTVGVEPNPEFWGETADKPRNVDLVSWMGRPSGGAFDMGRGGSTGLFRKPYFFREDAAGLEGVPIPVWTTKSFAASWEQTLKSPPLVANLSYHTKAARDKFLKITGKLENQLAVDLTDVWLIYDGNCYPIEGGLKSAKKGAVAREVALVDDMSRKDMVAWAQLSEPGTTRVWAIDPTSLVKKILFHQKTDTQNVVRNHLLRPIDQGWRVQDERRDLVTDRRTREAILFARVRHASGPGEAVTTDPELPLATKLWLGDIPGPNRSRPQLIGQLNQDTYIRVILPVRPVDE